MTPEERAAQVCFPEHNRVVYDHIVTVIRAAIAERDAQWGEAVKDQLLDCEACGHMFDIPGSRFATDGIPGACAKCDPLRSLLDPAGKGRTE